MNRKGKHKFRLAMLAALLGLLYTPSAAVAGVQSIQQRIEEKAAKAAKLKGTSVRVHAEDGLVVLTGSVRLYEQKLIYERITWKIEGVEEVDNEIRVVPIFPLPDEAIEQKIREIVKVHARFHGAELHTIVTESLVTITAVFEHPRDVLFLKHRVAEIEGVLEVQIEVLGSELNAMETTLGQTKIRDRAGFLPGYLSVGRPLLDACNRSITEESD